ncbi:MAG: DJ-1/PfpI family protein [Neisseriaceae bacterium]|nr:DJ-1/PfpI family protein [Neisseriaceae bacterium]
MNTAIFWLLDGYADWEGAYLSSRLHQSPDWQVKTASLTAGRCVSMGGFTTMVDYGLADLPDHVDVLVLLGGLGWDIDHPALSRLIGQYLAQGVKVGALCGAVDYLAKHGHLNQFKHTGNALAAWQDMAGYQNAAGFVPEQVVVDRHLITANGTAAVDFSAAMLIALGQGSAAAIAQEHALFKVGYYDYRAQHGDPYAAS